jgi:AraC-like DNA-binding protein
MAVEGDFCGAPPALLEERQKALATLIERYCSDDGVFETAIPGLFLYRSSTTSTPTCGVYRSAFTLIPQGGKRVMLGDETYEYGRNRYLVTSVDLPVMAQVTQASVAEPILGFIFDLEPAKIRRLMADMALPAVTATMARGLAVSDLTESVLGPALRLAQLLDTPKDIPILAPLLERELLYRLLTGERSAHLRNIAMADSHSHRIAQAIDWLKDNFDKPLSIDILANTANMSKSSLHQHFKALTAMSPLQYQKHLRLQEARRLMLMDEHDAASAGHRVGYESPSQFSREYRRLFGAPPLQDMARLRQGVGTAV